MDTPQKPGYRLFVVALRAGQAEGMVYHDDYPKTLPSGVIYQLRLDILDEAEKWCAMPVNDLMDIWRHLASRKLLPPSNVNTRT